MRIPRRNMMQLAVFTVVALTALSVMVFGYLKLPALLFGYGHYSVVVELPEAAGLYVRSNVTYRGAEIGRVRAVELHDGEVRAIVSLDSDIKIPSNTEAQVHSASAIGEQYLDLLPRDETSAPLKDGDVITLANTSVPPDVNLLLNATNRGLEAIPGNNLQTVIDESYTGIGGLGPELSRIVDASLTLSADARSNLDAVTTLIEQSPAVLDSQTESADSLHAWAANLASVTDQIRNKDAALSSLLPTGARATAESKALIDRLQPTVPILLANLVTGADVAITYQPNIEQLLVLYPANIANLQGSVLANAHQNRYSGGNMTLNLNTNLPPPCLTGYLPPQQVRTPTEVDAPDRPPGDLYCRVPQDSPWHVRGARNIPCETKPGKRAPTVKMCESDDVYVPLNDGNNWKGDPNATLSGQAVPQVMTHVDAPAPASPPQQAPPVTAVPYDPATGAYIGPDGKVYSQTNLAESTPKEQTWQSMLVPPIMTP